ncbi:glycosyltransferase family 4 protein [Microcoleus sp. FACHB-SPT15]|nr:glycosyltransferase family 4 protein [Microcoleus sp. FACHB-SPT15]
MPGKLASTSTSIQPTIALLGWGELFEDFHDTIGVSLESFRDELTGGWLFNYIDALRLAGVRTVLFFVSARVDATLRFTHTATGATVCVMPASRIHRAFRHYSTRSALFPGIKSSLGAYLATPLSLFARELQREGCNAILCQEYEYPRFDACVLLGKLIGMPVFATFQGGDKPLSRIEQPLRPLALKAAAGIIIAPQTEIERVLACYGMPLTKIARIFNPMDVVTWRAFDRSESRAALGIPLEARVAVYHGRIEIERKGLDVLVDAWKQVCDERPGKDLRLLLVGTGTDADELRQRIADMQLRGVMWVDEYVRDRTRIRQYLSAADVYTLASRQEGFPVAPIEAMACSLPVVAADAPGVPDIFEGGKASGGLVVPREDAVALAQALGRVLDDETWGRELGKCARTRAEECFSLEAIGKQLRDVLLSQTLQKKL